jgi:sulfatase modifying factor 1
MGRGARLTQVNPIDTVRSIVSSLVRLRRGLRLGLLAAVVQTIGCSGRVSDAPTGAGGGAAGSPGGGAGASSSPRSCVGLAASCGPARDDCCLSLPVPGGTFLRGYDNVTYTDQTHPASVSNFRLDKYEATVGRFRAFVAAWLTGWRPPSGAGKHTHLNNGMGLATADSTGYEPGWDSNWDSSVPSTSEDWNARLSCDSAFQTWTVDPAANEGRAIGCLNWFEAAAFCIWDNGFLPSEAEWNYAAAAGNEQRVFPWSVPSNDPAIDCNRANYRGGDDATLCTVGGISVAGSRSPVGDAKYGQADLSGNVTEWTLDWYADYSTDCHDCSNSTVGLIRVLHGGAFGNGISFQLVSNRDAGGPIGRASSIGVRCARTP